MRDGMEHDLTNAMNKPLKTARRSHFTLGDLIAAVSSSSRNSREATLAVMDLIQSHRVTIGRGRATSRRRH